MEEVIRIELLKYGFVPILIALERLNELEEYEICESIINVIKEHNDKYDLDIPTVLNGEAIAQMKIAFMTKFNLSGDIAYSNREHYADEIMKAIESQRIIDKSI